MACSKGLESSRGCMNAEEQMACRGVGEAASLDGRLHSTHMY